MCNVDVVAFKNKEAGFEPRRLGVQFKLREGTKKSKRIPGIESHDVNKLFVIVLFFWGVLHPLMFNY